MADEKTLEQLRAEALADPPAAPLRDDQGRFAAAQADEETVYVREIDLGDGSGVQHFEAATLEELVDKLASAQENATRLIREQAQTIRSAAPAKVVEIAPLTDDEKYIIGQQWMSDPEAAFRKMYDRTVAPTLNPKLEQAEVAARAGRESEATQEFLQKHPDFYPSPSNGGRITKYLRTYKMEGTVENLETVFQELSESGLLEARPAGTPGAEKTTEHTEPERIAPASRETRVTVRKVASGLSARRSAPTAPAEPTDDELRKMPLDELRQRAVVAARG